MRKPKRIIVAVLASGAYGREAAEGAVEYSRSHGGWEIHLDGASNHPGSIERLRLAMREWRADGILGQLLEPRLLRAIAGRRLPAVNISTSSRTALPTVCLDHEAAGRMAARYLLDRGLRRLAFCGRGGVLYSARRQEGFVAEARAGGAECCAFPPPGTKESNWLRDYRALTRWLLRLPRPVGILCCDDQRGQDVLRACAKAGLRVPEEAAVLGVDNDAAVCSLCVPELSSVITPARRIGWEAARLLDGILSGRRAPRGPVLVAPAGIAARRSSDMLATDDADLGAALQFIHNHCGEPIRVGDVVAAVAVSRRSLERRFVGVLGRTPRQEILRERIERARSLLGETAMKVAAVAQASGFLRYARFARAFRAETGMTPSQYRSGLRTSPARRARRAAGRT